VYCIGLNVIFSVGSATKFEQRVRYIFLQLVNKDSFVLLKGVEGDNYDKRANTFTSYLHLMTLETLLL